MAVNLRWAQFAQAVRSMWRRNSRTGVVGPGYQRHKLKEEPSGGLTRPQPGVWVIPEESQAAAPLASDVYYKTKAELLGQAPRLHSFSQRPVANGYSGIQTGG